MDYQDDIPVGPRARRLLEERIAAALPDGCTLLFVGVAELTADEVVRRVAPLAPIARLGAIDEFAIVLEAGTAPDAVLHALDAPSATITIGVASSTPGTTTGELLGAADQALREARRRAKEAADEASAGAAPAPARRSSLATSIPRAIGAARRPHPS